MLRSSTGCYLLAYSSFGYHTSVYAEARAVFFGVQKAKEKHVTLSLDSNRLSKIGTYAAGIYIIPWAIVYIVKHIKCLLASFQQARISHIFREGNNMADSLANWAVATESSADFTTFDELPKAAKGAFLLDKMGLPNIIRKK